LVLLIDIVMIPQPDAGGQAGEVKTILSRRS